MANSDADCRGTQHPASQENKKKKLMMILTSFPPVGMLPMLQLLIELFLESFPGAGSCTDDIALRGSHS